MTWGTRLTGASWELPQLLRDCWKNKAMLERFYRMRFPNVSNVE
jgi:hypothetical protein